MSDQGEINAERRVAHLRMIKYKIREEDQVERCPRGIDVRVRVGSIWHWPQRSEERVDGLSPHVPQHAHIAAPRGLDVLLDIKDQIFDERLVRVIRRDDLKRYRFVGQARTTTIQTANYLPRTFRAPHFAATRLGRPPPAPSSSTLRAA